MLLEERTRRRHAATALAALFRGFRVRKKLRARLRRHFTRYFDENTQMDYYLDARTGDTSWNLPRLLQGVEIPFHGFEEVPPAGKPSDETRMLEAQEMVLPKAVFGKANPIRMDVFVSSFPPERHLVQRGSFSSYFNRQEWSFVFSFFAFSSKIRGSTKFDVFQARKPDRSTVRISANGGDNAWTYDFSFFAFHQPFMSSERICVQKVPNPLRYRFTEEDEVRGGWRQAFQFYAYMGSCFSVHDAVYCESFFRRSLVLGNSCPEQEKQIEVFDHLDPDRTTYWIKKYEFFAFKFRFPGTTRFQILLNFHVNDGFSFPVMKLIQEGEGDTYGWELVEEFFAFTLPFPGTSKFYFQVARNPNRFRVSMHDLERTWTTLFHFFAFSSRECDQYVYNLN